MLTTGAHSSYYENYQCHDIFIPVRDLSYGAIRNLATLGQYVLRRDFRPASKISETIGKLTVAGPGGLK